MTSTLVFGSAVTVIRLRSSEVLYGESRTRSRVPSLTTSAASVSMVVSCGLWSDARPVTR